MNNSPKKKAIVYPYNSEFTPILRYSSKLHQYNVYKLIAPKSWGCVGKDASAADEGIPLHMIVESCIDDIFDADVIIIADFPHDDIILTKVKEVITTGIQREKEIICLKTLADDDIAYFKKYPNFRYYNNEAVWSRRRDKTLNTVNVPIICICGLIDNVNKFDVQIALNEYLKMKGYKITNITSKSYGKFLDFYPLPLSLYKNEDCITDKVNFLNNYIKSIEVKENPDAIILELPGGIMPYDDKITNNYGEIHNIVFNAVQCDFVCLNLSYSIVTKEFLEELRLIMKYRFNTSLDCFYFSNKNISKISLDFFGKYDWQIMPKSFFTSRFNELFENEKDNHIYNFVLEQNIKKLGDLVIDSL